MTKHKGRKSAVLAIAAFALIVSACGGSSDTATEEETSTKRQQLLFQVQECLLAK